MDDKSWKEHLNACVKCGTCLTVCPIYQETAREPLSARGKLALLSAAQRGLFPEDRSFYDLLSFCLLCGACAEQCPGGVKADVLIQEGRRRIMSGRGAAGLKRLLAKDGLPYPERMRAFRWAQDFLWRQIPKDRGLLLRLFPATSTLPLLKKPFFLERNLDLSSPSATFSTGKRLGLFIGCSINYLYPEVGEASLRVLSSLGKIVIPEDQTCCGLPAYSLGDMKTAKRLARRNVLAFSQAQADAWVVPCSSCAAHILSEYPRLLEKEDSLQTKLADFLAKTEELSRFLIGNNLYPPIPQHLPPLHVVFHDPCHSRRKLRIMEEPRRLLLSRPGLTLAERKECSCCGGGGLFRLSHPDLSRKIGAHSLKAIEETGAEVLATSCMACLMQLQTLAGERENRKVVRHWLEILV